MVGVPIGWLRPGRSSLVKPASPLLTCRQLATFVLNMQAAALVLKVTATLFSGPFLIGLLVLATPA